MNQTATTHQKVMRAVIYLVGIVTLAVGITLNTITGLGVSPLISMPFCVSQIWSLSFPVMTFIAYSAFVGIQFLLRGKHSRIRDLLQLPFSLVFSGLLSLCGMVLDFTLPHLWQNLLLLVLGIVLTGVGAAMTVNMRLVANPADALAQTVGEVTKKGMGLGKNIIDFSGSGHHTAHWSDCGPSSGRHWRRHGGGHDRHRPRGGDLQPLLQGEDERAAGLE